jgi:hypothetical protein
LLAAALLASLLVPLGLSRQFATQVSTPTVKAHWPGYARNAQHEALWPTATQPLSKILWTTPVDLFPQYSGDYLLIHYGSPLVTRHSTVIVTVKTGVSEGFAVEGRNLFDGSLLWSQPTDYTLPTHDWTPSCGSTLTPQNRLITPGKAGKVIVRLDADSPGPQVLQVYFYGQAEYDAAPSTYDTAVKISTPITSDKHGNLYFGFVVNGFTPLNLASGLARIDLHGKGTWISAADAAQDANIKKVVYNCAPGLSVDGKVVYVAVTTNAGSGSGTGYLLGLDSTTLAPLYRVQLMDVKNPANKAPLPDDGTASPTIGPDGDVYFGTNERPLGSNHLRGWMQHFDKTLSQAKIPGAFGWDDTASIVPRGAVPGYTGPSSYLLLTKYNNYAGGGGDGVNKVAVLDPNVSMTDPISGATVMKEVLTIAGPTPDPDHRDSSHPNAVREWCINTAAVDVENHSALVNNEDGILYRWDFVTNTLSQNVVLTVGIGEAYTPTLVGTDGTVFAINNAILFAVGN